MILKFFIKITHKLNVYSTHHKSNIPYLSSDNSHLAVFERDLAIKVGNTSSNAVVLLVSSRQRGNASRQQTEEAAKKSREVKLPPQRQPPAACA